VVGEVVVDELDADGPFVDGGRDALDGAVVADVSPLTS
jgi:hypothetical protein